LFCKITPRAAVIERVGLSDSDKPTASFENPG